MSHREHLSASAFDTGLSHLAVATADESDELIDRHVSEVLRLVLNHLEMDVVFVSHFEDGRRKFRNVLAIEGKEVIAAGQSDPLEVSFCKRVIDGRLPELVRDVAKLPTFSDLPPTQFPIGAHLSTPIVLKSGEVYGTFCCFSFAPNEALTQRDLKRLRMAAEMTARLLDKAEKRTNGV